MEQSHTELTQCLLARISRSVMHDFSCSPPVDFMHQRQRVVMLSHDVLNRMFTAVIIRDIVQAWD